MDNKPPSFLISIRFLVAIIAFLGYAVQYIQRINMSVAIVCMINNTALKEMTMESQKLLNDSTDLVSRSNLNQTIDVSKCLFQELKAGKKFDGDFAWSKKLQGLVLSAYFYGYLTTQVAGGFLSLRFGAKIVLAGAILVGSILTLIIPVAAKLDYKALVACRFFIGVAHGAFWPAMSTLWSRWAPPTERSRLAGVANAGAQIGNVVALPLGGYLCINGFAGGWPSIFYVFGAIGIVWFVLWMILVSKSPEDHRFIKDKERDYIIEQTKEGLSVKKQPILTVTKNILTSKAFYALLICHACSNFGTYLFLTQLPTYMKEILKFDIKSNGGLSALPYICFWFLTIISSVVGDKLISTNTLSKTAVRKLFNIIGNILPASAVIGLAFVTCAHPYVGVALLTFGLATTGCAYGAGFMVNYNDVAGSYAGFTFGLSNTVGTVPGIIAPYLVGVLTTNQLQEEWQTVFYITAAVYACGAIGFFILGSGELQPWAKVKKVVVDNENQEEIPLQEK